VVLAIQTLHVFHSGQEIHLASEGPQHVSLLFPLFSSLRSKYRIRTPDAFLIATSMNEKADAFITNDASLRALRDEGITVLVLADFVR
jgi:predicted nucleic acid-binding protein